MITLPSESTGHSRSKTTPEGRTVPPLSPEVTVSSPKCTLPGATTAPCAFVSTPTSSHSVETIRPELFENENDAALAGEGSETTADSAAVEATTVATFMIDVRGDFMDMIACSWVRLE
jgi:hypothetical protein